MKRNLYTLFFKPLIDYTVAILLSIILIPIWIIIPILIKLTSPGPVFFYQERLGKNGTVFRIIKFRTMTHKVRIPSQTTNTDPDVTLIGKFLRRTKIDELPQLIHILNGTMSLVGPRPSLPNLVDSFDENGKYRILVKPGTTNYAAVNGSIFLTWPERWVYDRHYVENVSFLLDLEIVFKTIVVMVMGEKFYYKPKI